MLISGQIPFDGDSMIQILDNIKNNEVKFEGKIWADISQDAKDFITQCLNKDKDLRITAAEALSSPWFCSQPKLIEYKITDEIIEALMNYKATSILKKEALSVLVKLINEDLIQDLREIFRSIDTDFTGMISSKELNEAAKAAGRRFSKSELKEIIHNCNYNNDGKINYSDFLAATLSPKNLASNNSLLWALFKHFDVDDSDEITRDNIIESIQKSGRSVTDDDIQTIFNEHDTQRDGKISFDEFRLMLKHLLVNN